MVNTLVPELYLKRARGGGHKGFPGKTMVQNSDAPPWPLSYSGAEMLGLVKVSAGPEFPVSPGSVRGSETAAAGPMLRVASFSLGKGSWEQCILFPRIPGTRQQWVLVKLEGILIGF